LHQEPASALVGNVFRSLLPIVYDLAGQADATHSIAMPLLAAGDQGQSPAAMMGALLQAASHWFALGVPVDTIKIVEINPSRASAARQAFEEFKQQRFQLGRATSSKYDVFISYAHEDADRALEIARWFSQAKLRVFMDRLSIDIGSSWQAEIFAAMDECTRVVTMYSPDYLASDVCKEELNVAYARQRGKNGVLVPVYLRTTRLPTYLELVTYLDAREGTSTRLEAIWPALYQACR
jgi:hypothetical protein